MVSVVKIESKDGKRGEWRDSEASKILLNGDDQTQARQQIGWLTKKQT